MGISEVNVQNRVVNNTKVRFKDFTHPLLYYKTEKKENFARVTNFWLMWLVIILSGNTKISAM